MKLPSFSVETSKVIATEPGQKLEATTGFVSAVVETVRQITIGFLQRLTFQDNIDCKISTIEVVNDTEQVINVLPSWGSPRRPLGIKDLQVISETYGCDSFHWWTAADGTTKVKVTFTGSPASTTLIKVVILILYG